MNTEKRQNVMNRSKPKALWKVIFLDLLVGALTLGLVVFFQIGLPFLQGKLRSAELQAAREAAQAAPPAVSVAPVTATPSPVPETPAVEIPVVQSAAESTPEPTAEPTTEAPTYSVPYVVGMTAKDAYYELNDAGVTYTVKREYSENVKPETVMGQEPEEGFVTPDQTVLIIISKGTDQPDTTVPSTTKKSDKDKQTTTAPAGEYVLAGSDSRYIDRSEVANMNEKQLTLALNEIYARKGRRFNSSELQAYFNSKSWYNGTISPSQFDENSLNKYEKANVQTILAVMREKGYR